MKKYEIYAGLGGGFGGAQYIGVLEFESVEEAEEYAYEEACQIYESYDGCHGLMSIEDIMEEEECDEEEAGEIWIDQRENWLSYYVEEL